MKKVLFFFCAFAMMMFMTSCGGADTSTPEGVADAYMKCAANQDVDGMVALMDLDDKTKDTIKGLLALGMSEFKDISYKILDTKVDGEKAVVNVEISKGGEKKTDKVNVKKKDGKWYVDAGK